MAAECFRSLGNFASYVYIPDELHRSWSDERGEAFARAVSAIRHRTEIYDSSQESLSSFLSRQELPVAVFTAWDFVAAKVIRNRVKLQQHPTAVITTRTDGTVQGDNVLTLVLTFVVAYILLVLVGTIIYAMFGCDIMTSFTASIACIGNVGPGFGEVGSLDNYSELPTILKLNSTLLMLVGRLEIFGFIQLFFLRSWR